LDRHNVTSVDESLHLDDDDLANGHDGTDGVRSPTESVEGLEEGYES
jgi:hypothetical protein